MQWAAAWLLSSPMATKIKRNNENGRKSMQSASGIDRVEESFVVIGYPNKYLGDDRRTDCSCDNINSGPLGDYSLRERNGKNAASGYR